MSKAKPKDDVLVNQEDANVNPEPVQNKQPVVEEQKQESNNVEENNEIKGNKDTPLVQVYRKSGPIEHMSIR